MARQVTDLRKLGFQVTDKATARVIVELHNQQAFGEIPGLTATTPATSVKLPGAQGLRVDVLAPVRELGGHHQNTGTGVGSSDDPAFRLFAGRHRIRSIAGRRTLHPRSPALSLPSRLAQAFFQHQAQGFSEKSGKRPATGVCTGRTPGRN